MTKELTQSIRTMQSDEQAMAIFGPQNSNLSIFEDDLEVTLNTRGNQLIINGTEEEVLQMGEILAQLEQLGEKKITIQPMDIINAIRLSQDGKLDQFIRMYEKEITRDYNGRPIRVKNVGQSNYVQAVKSNDIVFGVGPAGTGKTFLAVAMAVAALRKGEVKRIILTRPAVEAGENLGFLPGDLKEKVDPYLRPLYDSLYTILGVEHTGRLMERETIEIAPLAYMRGRTLDDAFVILDEAQNTTIQQMKMFITRLGFGSKMIINGDVTQIDLPRGTKSGLIHAQRTLNNVDGIGMVNFDSADVIRHPLVSKVINAYEEQEKAEKENTIK
ncbi:MAG TPA: PhoH family protein [Atopostipes sp.]|nr:PhoH family protein [Atopostipes sp.]